MSGGCSVVPHFCSFTDKHWMGHFLSSEAPPPPTLPKHIEGAWTIAKKSWAYSTVIFIYIPNQETLCQLYVLSLRVCSTIFGHLQSLLESTHKFACKMITKSWDKGYDELLNMTILPSLADRRLYLKLSSLPPKTVLPKVARLYTSIPFNVYQPFGHTFVPHVVSPSNSLPVDIVSAPSPSTFMNMHLNIIIIMHYINHLFIISRVQSSLAIYAILYLLLIPKKFIKKKLWQLCYRIGDHFHGFPRADFTVIDQSLKLFHFSNVRVWFHPNWALSSGLCRAVMRPN